MVQREASFIAPELPYLKENFDVTIVPLQRCSHSPVARVVALAKSLVSPMLYRQVLKAKKLGKSPFKVFQFALFMLWRANTYAAYLKKHVFTEKDAIVYGYWYNEIVLSALLLKKQFPQYRYITRCHGYDVYDFRVPGGYHPYKEFMDSRLDRIIFACGDAKKYYLDRHNKTESPKYVLSHLGVPPKNIDPNKTNHDKDTLTLVSCSAVIGLKRIHLIVDALAQINDFDVHWHHFGDGDQMNNLKERAAQLDTKENIKYTLHGFVANGEYIETLGSMGADLFITTSSTEGGVPVSLSEAASFGIACIGTDVGGIPELVSDKNGTLLCADPTAAQVAEAIADFYYLSSEQKNQKGDNSYKIWQSLFNSETNAKNVIELLKQL